jgi:nitrogen fixation NifU-like protein
MNTEPQESDASAPQDHFFGRMNDPSAGAWVTGPCGDTMEFYLIIENDVIRRVQYHTDGCGYTRLCGLTVAMYVQGKTLMEALSVSGKGLLDVLPQLPPEHRHCAILAVGTLHRAIGQYWVETVCS